MGKNNRGRISGGEILKRPGSDAGCRDKEEEDISKKAFCKFVYCIMQYIFSAVVVNSINAYRVRRCCVWKWNSEIQRHGTKTEMSLH